MPTSALVETTVHAAPAVPFGIATTAEPPNRRIAWATGLSAIVHLALLLAVGISTIESSNLNLVPELRLQVQIEDGRDNEHDNSPATVDRPAAHTAALLEESPAAAVADKQFSDIEPIPGASASPPPPAQEELTQDATVASGSLPSESPSPEESNVLATTGTSTFEVAAPAEAAQAEPQQLSNPTPQQTKLTRWVTQAVQGLPDADLAPAPLSYQEDGKEYTVQVERRPAADDTGIERLIVEVTTQEKGKKLRTQMQMKRLAFSHYTQLVDHWDTEVQLHDDEVNGRFHSNSEIFLGYDQRAAPKFLGKVSTAAGGFTIATAFGRKRRDEIFQGGFETRAGRITLPERFAAFVSDKHASNAEMRPFSRDARVTFYSDGTYGWQEIGSVAPEQRQAMPDAPTYFVGARNTTLYVRGIVGGKVLVYSPDRIVIEGSLVYTHDPRLAPDANDYLGLVSDKYIEIAPPGMTGKGDLEVDAAVYARRRFVVTDEQVSGHATLYIYGSLTAGSLSATEPRYATKVKFDPRFERQRPPGFPVTNHYEVESWDGQWQDADADLGRVR